MNSVNKVWKLPLRVNSMFPSDFGQRLGFFSAGEILRAIQIGVGFLYTISAGSYFIYHI